MSQMTAVDPNIEIYKTYVDTAERSIDRRIETNKFFLTLVAGIFVAYAFLLEDKLKRVPESIDLLGTIAYWTLPVLLLIVSYTWFLSIRAFRSISTAKYNVISEMERQLPHKPFLTEWETRNVKFLTGTRIEMIVPLVFCLVAVCGLALPAYFRYARLFLH